MNRFRCSGIPIIVAALAILVFAISALSAAPQAVPNPTVRGPIPAGALPGDSSHDYPFFSTNIDLAPQRYVEEEYFLSGTANVYQVRYPLETASTTGVSSPYETRMVVRRPTSAANFNGTVLVEWQMDYLGFGADATWLWSPEHLIRRGYAWVGVTAFRAGVHQSFTGLKAWSPKRYATLNINSDALAFDIYSQAAQAVRNPMGIDPMGGLRVERVFAIGCSQAVNLGLLPYHNNIHPLAGVFDAFLMYIGGGQAALRRDLDVNVFKVWTENEAIRSLMVGRQSDFARLRRWEVAGGSHLDWDAAQALAPLRVRDFGMAVTPSCNETPYSRIPSRHVLNAAIDWLLVWVEYGVEPPIAPKIEISAYGPPNAVERDRYGNALGGIRLAQHEVATATNTAVNSTSACSLLGSYAPFEQATLDALYRNHGAYVSRVAKVTIDNMMKGFVVSEDALATIEAAAHSSIGKK